jgi:acetoacetyl-[acyl-carrier protein] synthase
MEWGAAFLNAKGFGGNNATATIASPGVAMKWLEHRHGRSAITTWQQRNEAVVEQADSWDRALTAGTAEIVYRFDHEVRGEEHVQIVDGELRIEGYAPIPLLD